MGRFPACVSDLRDHRLYAVANMAVAAKHDLPRARVRSHSDGNCEAVKVKFSAWNREVVE